MPLMQNFKNNHRRRQNQQQKQQTELNRESGTKLMKALQNVEMGLSGIENKESRQVFKSITQTFREYIDNSPVIGQYDVAEIDQILLEMITIYGNALKNGDLATAKRCVDRIQDALANHRKELDTLEAARQGEVLNERIARLGQYKTVLVTSDKVFTNQRNVQVKEKEYVALKTKYEDLFEWVEKYIQAHPGHYEMLLELRPGIDEVPEEAQELNTNMANMRAMADQVADLKAAMETFRTQYNAQLSSLNQLEMMLTVKNGLLTQEEEKQMNAAMETYKNQLQSATLEVQKLGEMQESRHIAITQIMSSMAVGKEVVKNTQKYEELRRKHQMELEDAARGMANQQQLENEKQLQTN